MRSRLVWLGIAACVVVLATGCRGRQLEATVGERPCQPADDQAGLISERLANGATKLRQPQRVRLDPPVGQYGFVVAAEVEGEIGVWSVGPWVGGARVMGVDDVARRWSTWGAAIPDDSPAGRQREQLAARPEVARARACVDRQR